MDIETAKHLANHAARRVEFKGALNCRDLGGLPMPGGKVTRHGRVYRSGRLNNLTVTDRQRFRDLGVCQAFDLRMPFEREKFPNPPAADLGAEMRAEGYLPEGALEMFEAINDGTITPDQVRIGMRNQYVSMATAHPEVHAALFRGLLASQSKPFLFHCSGGKDRTGVASAMLLRGAGVEREVVIADYLLTNLDVPPLGVLHGAVAPELTAVVGFAHAELIEAAMDAVENQFQSYADYFMRGIGLTEAEYETLLGVLVE
ncbi:MAG: tyrosine-protein phosphatase [Gammaproteobacteria bacterium]